MDQLLQFVHAHIGMSHSAVMVVGSLAARYLFPIIVKDAKIEAIRAVQAQRDQLKRFGVADSIISTLDEQEAKLTQDLLDALKADANPQQQGDQPK